MTARTVTRHCPPRTVLVGVDFGDASARALAIANVVAAGFNARLRVLRAERFEPPPYFTVASALMCAEHFAGLARGTVTKAGPLAACDAAAFQQASLVMMPTPTDRTSWVFSDSVARILGGCDRPVLFIRTL